MSSFVSSLEKGEEDEFQGRASIRELEEIYGDVVMI